MNRTKNYDYELRCADQQISDCTWCGAGTIHGNQLCTHCNEHGYPTLGAAA